MRTIKKIDLREANYVVNKDNYNDIKHEIEDDDVVKIIDENDEVVHPEFLSDIKGEPTFKVNDKKFNYCWAKYPNNKKDVGVYSHSEDIVYGIDYFKKNILNQVNENKPKAIITKKDLMKTIKEHYEKKHKK